MRAGAHCGSAEIFGAFRRAGYSAIFDAAATLAPRCGESENGLPRCRKRSHHRIPAGLRPGPRLREQRQRQRQLQRPETIAKVAPRCTSIWPLLDSLKASKAPCRSTTGNLDECLSRHSSTREARTRFRLRSICQALEKLEQWRGIRPRSGSSSFSRCPTAPSFKICSQRGFGKTRLRPAAPTAGIGGRPAETPSARQDQ